MKTKKEEKYNISVCQLMKLNAPEWRYILVGCIASVLHGATFPIWAVLFGDFFGVSNTFAKLTGWCVCLVFEGC